MIDKMLLINFNVIHIIHYKYINGVIFDEIYSLYFSISYVKLIKKNKKILKLLKLTNARVVFEFWEFDFITSFVVY